MKRIPWAFPVIAFAILPAVVSGDILVLRADDGSTRSVEGTLVAEGNEFRVHVAANEVSTEFRIRKDQLVSQAESPKAPPLEDLKSQIDKDPLRAIGEIETYWRDPAYQTYHPQLTALYQSAADACLDKIETDLSTGDTKMIQTLRRKLEGAVAEGMLTRETASQFTDRINIYVGKSKQPAPFPTPTRTPGPTPNPFQTFPPSATPAVPVHPVPSPKAPVATPSPAPLPAPAPAPAPPARASAIDRLLARDWSALADLPGELMNSELMPLLLGLAGFIVVYWIVPAKVLRGRARRGDMDASLWGARTRLLGIFALGGYLYGVARKPRKVRDRCPICKKPIDNIDDYADFNFFVCPHCGENITPVYDLKDYLRHLVEQVEREVRRRRGQYSETAVEKDATLKLVRGLIIRSIHSRASDLHIDCGEEGANVRSRVDGVLYDTVFLPKVIVPSVVSAIKVMANLDIAEKRVPQDGKFSLWVEEGDIDVRINTSPAIHGEKVSMRLLDKRAIARKPADLGIEGANYALFEQAIARPHGLVIVTGPSGSGKSTTLYVALTQINSGDKNIITLEDPIEYELKGLTQMQVNPVANFTFATGLRSIVRQDPDVIMVGEVRDKETAEMAIESAVTGHLVMTTMHTIDTTTVFTRLTDMGIDSRRYASALLIVISQRLIRVNCPECRKPYQPSPKHLAALRLEASAKDIIFVKGQGCPHCQQTGYYGRTGLFEFFAPDRELRVLLEQSAAASKLRELARHKGMRNLREEGMNKVLHGLTSLEEVVKATM
jgi:type II secretory ATPase GspE/PulE/Tfp pilus assembly ATPase PilB-like protein